MIGRRTIINLFTFFGLSFALILYGYFSLVQNPLNRPTTLYSYLPDTGGVRSGFTVAMRGVPVGHVGHLALAGNTVKVSIAIEPGVQVPSDAKVQVERANPLGEQQVELLLSGNPAAPPAKAGQVLAATDTPTPPDVGALVDAADRLFASIPTDQLGTVVHELSVAFNGRAQDVRTLIEAGDTFSRNTLAYSQQFRELLANSPPILDTVASVGPQLHDALLNTEVLADLIDRRANDLVNLFRSGTAFANTANTFIDQNTPNLACLTKDLADVGGNLSIQPQLTNLDNSLLLNPYFFGPINAITPIGHVTSLGPGSPTRDNQTWFRVRTLLPPQQPAAVSYTTAHHIPDTYPGAACLSVFGAGVPAGHQVNAAPPVETGKVIPPPAVSVPVEHQSTPTPSGGGTGPGNVLGAGAGAGTAAAATPKPAAPGPAPKQAKHPETLVFVGFGLAGLGALERRELGRFRRQRRRARSRRSRR